MTLKPCEYDSCGTIDNILREALLKEGMKNINDFLFSLSVSPESLIESENSPLFVTESNDYMIGL